MGAALRRQWLADGGPFRLGQPLRDLRDRLRNYGYVVYDIGNREHLEADPPEDHTPYSVTGYPRTARYGIGYAIDVMPPPASKRLPSLQQLGAQLLKDRNAGHAGISWLKYMNWEPERDNGGACWHEAWQPKYRRTTSRDRGHIHLSSLTGFEDSTVGAGYDPVARINGEDDDMNAAQFLAILRDPEVAKAMRALPWQYTGGGIPVGMSTLGVLNATHTNATKAAGLELDVDESAIVAGVLAGLSPRAIAAAVVEALPDDQAQQVVDELAARLGAQPAPDGN